MFGRWFINNKDRMKVNGRPRELKDGEKWVRLSIALPPAEAEEFEKLRGKTPRSKFLLLCFEKWKEFRRAEIKEKLKAQAS